MPKTKEQTHPLASALQGKNHEQSDPLYRDYLQYTTFMKQSTHSHKSHTTSNTPIPSPESPHIALPIVDG